jgi:hypothetical protein
MRIRPLALGLVLLAAPCASAQTPAPVAGDPADLARFAGEWTGGFTCEEAGWHGTLSFRLAAGEDSVRAVVLVARTPDAGDSEAVPLAVRHVAVEGRSLRGSLAHYEGPEGGGPLETTFGGSLSGDGRAEGYFRAVGGGQDASPQCGRWWATRSPARPAAQR